MNIQAEISLYPLRRKTMSEVIYPFVEQLQARGLEVEMGSLSTTVRGPAGELFDAVRDAFEQAAENGDVALILKATNALP